MSDFLCDLWNSQGFRYVGATLIGFLVSFGTQWITSYVDRRRLRTAVRESLAEEVADNLFVLDSYWNAMKGNLGGREPNWPTARPRTAMLERCLDSSVIAILTEIEQVQSALAYYQCVELADKLEKGREVFRQHPHLITNRSENILDNLPFVAQTFMDLLVNVLMEQQVFSSSRSASMAHRLIPLFEDNFLKPNRTWRTSSLPESQRVGRYLVAWRNDAREQMPAGLEVIELVPTEGPHRIINLRQTYWYRRWHGIIERRWRLMRFRQSAERFPEATTPKSLPGKHASDPQTSAEPRATTEAGEMTNQTG